MGEGGLKKRMHILGRTEEGLKDHQGQTQGQVGHGGKGGGRVLGTEVVRGPAGRSILAQGAEGSAELCCLQISAAPCWL